MSSGTAANYGYMLPATEENITKLKIDISEYHDWKEENPECDLDDFFEEEMDQGNPLLSNMTNPPTEIYLYLYHSEDGDIYDDLEDIGFYFMFDEEDLYEMKTTPFGNTLREIGAMPEFKMWTTFG
jgi:hypothetical protein